MSALLILLMMQPEVRCKMTLAYANTATTPIVARLVSVNKDNLRKLSTSMFLQNTVHGQSTLKQVYQVGRSRWIHMQMQKKQAIKTCEHGGKNKPCKVLVWVRNSCIAVAQGKDGKLFFGTTPPGMAEAEALRKCQERGTLQCRIIATEGCSMPKF